MCNRASSSVLELSNGAKVIGRPLIGLSDGLSLVVTDDILLTAGIKSTKEEKRTSETKKNVVRRTWSNQSNEVFRNATNGVVQGEQNVWWQVAFLCQNVVRRFDEQIE